MGPQLMNPQAVLRTLPKLCSPSERLWLAWVSFWKLHWSTKAPDTVIGPWECHSSPLGMSLIVFLLCWEGSGARQLKVSIVGSRPVIFFPFAAFC